MLTKTTSSTVGPGDQTDDPPEEAAGGGEAAAAVWSLAAKNGIKSVASLDKELDSLPPLLSLWTRSCFPPRGVGEEWGSQGRWYSGVRSLPGHCRLTTSEGPHQATPAPTPPPPLKKQVSMFGQQLQPVRGLSLRIGQGLVHATAAYLSLQDATPGRASTQLDNNTAD
ncbi:hypothetical protein Q8A73_002823 [Channa argus]|nr:hypothetical protein Q8A73_002823 [Channa argus]